LCHSDPPLEDLLLTTIANVAEVMMYAIAQKEQLGFDKAVEVHCVHIQPSPQPILLPYNVP
jgi:hypothetical protein